MKYNKRAEAARRNGAKSQGPTTTEGRLKCAQARVTHGLCAENALLISDDKEKYQRLRQIYFDQFQPATAFEAELTEKLANLAWRLRRAEAWEAALIDLEADIRMPDIQKAFQTIDTPTLQAFAFKSLADSSKALQALDRHESRIQRQYDRTRQELLDTQAERRANEAEQAEGPNEAVIAPPAEGPNVAQPIPIQQHTDTKVEDIPPCKAA